MWLVLLASQEPGGCLNHHGAVSQLDRTHALWEISGTWPRAPTRDSILRLACRESSWTPIWQVSRPSASETDENLLGCQWYKASVHKIRCLSVALVVVIAHHNFAAVLSDR
jgi:hypothetical protein